MSGGDLALGLAVFMVVLALIEGRRMSMGLLDRTMPASARIRERLRRAGEAAGPPRESICKEGRLADARLLRRCLARYAFTAGVERLLAQAGMRIKVAPFLLLTLGLAGLPWLLALRRRRSRLARMEQQLPGALDLLCRALRAGHALPSALRIAAQDTEAPLADELRIMVDEIGYGASLPDAMRRTASRNPGGDIGCFAVAVLIQRETGGNLTELLAGIAALVRERQMLRGQVRVHTAEARLSALILALLPFVLAAALYLAHPAFMSLLWTDALGRRLLMAALAMLALGVLWMRALVRIAP